MTIRGLSRMACVVALPLWLAACRHEVDGDAAVTVADATLTNAQIRQAVPSGLSHSDSLKFVRSYIRNWIDDRLIDRIAINNIPDTREIDRMVDEYRRKLIIWEYRRRITSEHGETVFPKDTILAYYDRHSTELRTAYPVAKGIYIRVADNHPRLPELRKWFRSTKASDMDKIEKAGLSDDEYSYFRDRWTPWKSIEALVPADMAPQAAANAAAKRPSELSAGGFTYLIDISEYLPAGSVMPLELAETAIIEKLRADSRSQYDRKLRQELYDKAMADGKIVIY